MGNKRIYIFTILNVCSFVHHTIQTWIDKNHGIWLILVGDQGQESPIARSTMSSIVTVLQSTDSSILLNGLNVGFKVFQQVAEIRRAKFKFEKQFKKFTFPFTLSLNLQRLNIVKVSGASSQKSQFKTSLMLLKGGWFSFALTHSGVSEEMSWHTVKPIVTNCWSRIKKTSGTEQRRKIRWYIQQKGKNCLPMWTQEFCRWNKVVKRECNKINWKKWQSAAEARWRIKKSWSQGEQWRKNKACYK